MNCKISINMDNAAFTDNQRELAEMLTLVAYKVELGHTDGKIMDSNGNHVGTFEIRDEE